MLRKIALNLFLAAMFGIAGLMVVPAALGLHRYVILTGSMTGTYDPGSIVFDKQVPTSSLEIGDAITYAPPPGMSPNHELVTHRIVKISPVAEASASTRPRATPTRPPTGGASTSPRPSRTRSCSACPTPATFSPSSA